MRLVADPVIEAIGRLELENGLKKGVLPGGCWYPCGGSLQGGLPSNFLLHVTKMGVKIQARNESHFSIALERGIALSVAKKILKI